MQMSPYTTVGYETQNLAAGQQAIGGNFIAIGTNGCWLSEIQVGGIDRSNAAISIQTLGSQGEPLALYNYYKSSTGIHKTDGWYKGTGNVRYTKDNDIYFASGTGLWIKGVANATLTISGEVVQRDVSVILGDGQQMLANPYPANIGLSTIEISNIDRSNAAISIQTLGETGQPLALYNFYKNSTGIHKTDGWYKGTGNVRYTPDNDISITSGMGLWVKGVKGTVLTFKKPF